MQNWRVLAFIFLLTIGIAHRAITSDITATLDSNDGSSAFTFRDSISAVVAKINSNGGMILEDTLEVRGDGESYFAGSVGIGTTSPGASLEVAGTIECSAGGFKFPDGSAQRFSGKVINVTYHVSNTRWVLPAASSYTIETIPVNKLSSTSTLIIQGAISAHGGQAGHLQQGWKYGAGAEWFGQTIFYEDATSWGKVYPTYGVIENHTTTGTQNLVFRLFDRNSATIWTPFAVYNPNWLDDAGNGGRLQQTQSVYVIWEVESS